MNNEIVKEIFNKVGLGKSFISYFPLPFNHFNNLSVDQQLMTSFFVSQARRVITIMKTLRLVGPSLIFILGGHQVS